MTHSPSRRTPTTYRLQVAGHLDQHWSAWFGGFQLTHEHGGTTTLTGLVSDQAQLHGLLTKIRDLGVTLLSVAVVGPLPDIDHPPQSLATREVPAVSLRAPAEPSDRVGPSTADPGLDHAAATATAWSTSRRSSRSPGLPGA